MNPVRIPWTPASVRRAGAIAGAAVGAVAGPVGAAIGLIAGAVAGGLAGKQVAEKIDPTVEDEYWRTHYAEAPYAERGVPYDSWSTAYRVGYEGFQKHPGADFEEVEPALRGEYDRSKGAARLGWRKARLAARDAWMRLRARSIETSNAEPRPPKCGDS